MIDARGRSCPEPVLMLRKAMESKESQYTIAVDNRVSVENITRFARHEGYQVTVLQDGDEWRLQLDR